MSKFIKIDMNLFQDKDLNNTERIILSYINSFPNGYFSTITFMADTLGQTRESISKNINQLLKKGYVERFVNVKNDYGQCEKNSQPPLKKFTESVKKIHTNKKDNKYNNKFDKIVIPETEQKTDQTKPTKEEVYKYFFDKGLNGDAGKFFEHYDRYNWQYDGQPINWREKAEKWSEREFKVRPIQTEIERDEELDAIF